MKGSVLCVCVCLLALQCIQYGTDAQFINVPKYVRNIGNMYNRLWRGRPNPNHFEVQYAQSSEFQPIRNSLKWNDQLPRTNGWGGYEQEQWRQMPSYSHSHNPSNDQIYGPPKNNFYGPHFVDPHKPTAEPSYPTPPILTPTAQPLNPTSQPLNPTPPPLNPTAQPLNPTTPEINNSACGNDSIVPTPLPPIKIAVREPVHPDHSITHHTQKEFSPSQSEYDIKEESYQRHPGRNLAVNDKPKSNTHVIVTRVIETPDISAPLQGYNRNRGINPPTDNFHLGLMQRNAVIKNRKVDDSLFESQIQILGAVFDQIQSLEEEHLNLTPTPGGTYGENRIEAPFFVYQIQRSTIPDPNTTEHNLLDAHYNFGHPATPIQFGDLNVIKDQWEATRNAPEDIHLHHLGRSGPEISHTFHRWVKHNMASKRKTFRDSYSPAERKAHEGFVITQYLHFRNPGQCPVILKPPVPYAPYAFLPPSSGRYTATRVRGTRSVMCGSGNKRYS